MANVDNEDLVSTYFYIQHRIDRAKGRIEEYEQDFNNKNFYTCIQERYEVMTTVAFRLEKEVTDHVAAIEMAEQHIETLQFKLKHFDRFWSEVSSSDKEYYLDRYKRHRETINDNLDNLIVDEIREIEEAASYQISGVIPIVLTNKLVEESDPNESLNQMLEMLGV